ncbi:hypothetical protein SRB17_06320 [Streptomyces sp. RB17]|nr:hypothetical protein [Streptomyces sp. RB17]
MRRLTPVLALGALLLTALPAHAAAGPAHRESYGTKAPYEPEQSAHTYQWPPAGYTAVFTENVSRHGSRSATGGEDGDLILGLWDKAQEEGQLTGRGGEFGPTVRALMAAMEKVGYGNLSGRGRQEMRDTATRMQQRLPALFARIADRGEKIDVVSSGQGRAVDSASEYTGALAFADPALRPLIGATRRTRTCCTSTRRRAVRRTATTLPTTSASRTR